MRYFSIRARSRGWSACCPAHDDTNPSLTIDEGEYDGNGNRKVLLKCWAGCTFKEIMATLFPAVGCSSPTHGLKIRAKAKPKASARRGPAVAAYDYLDADGELLYQVRRFDQPKKTFRARRPNGTGWIDNLNGTQHVLYHLPELAEADSEVYVYIVEGEKDADRLHDEGMIATTNPFGAEADFAVVDSTPLHGHNVIVLADNDEVGRKHAEQVAAVLHDKAASVRVLHLPDLPENGDVSDWLDNGHDSEDLDTLAVKTEQWVPGSLLSDTSASSRLHVTSFADVEPETIQWLWPNRIPLGKLTVLAGLGGLGKSFVTLDIAARVSIRGGATWPDDVRCDLDG